jgi:hypothetical protein
MTVTEDQMCTPMDNSHMYREVSVFSSYGSPHAVLDPDGSLKIVTRINHKILHYVMLYTDRPDPIVFIPLSVNTLRTPRITWMMIFCS